ncbi:MAG TPA: C4-dicarboxylate ABC transporter permease, partial [Clostridiales bacterium]|nr:C4-dicarboxylate ABC transporter permease [Clostridiales bacterium]
MSVIVIILMIAMLLCGFPMLASFAVGAFGLILAIQPSLSMTFVIQQFIAGISGFTLLSIPMFIFAAEIMSFGRTANHLVDLVKAFVGHISGGLAITVAGACTIFGAISGSSNATVVAIGKPMRSRMIENGYDQQNTDALICASAIIAVLIPPSINMIMYCVLTGTSVGELFVAGVIP